MGTINLMFGAWVYINRLWVSGLWDFKNKGNSIKGGKMDNRIILAIIVMAAVIAFHVGRYNFPKKG